MKEKVKIRLSLTLVIAFFLCLFIFKDDMMNAVGRGMQKSVSVAQKDSLEVAISDLYNYAQNGQSFQYTFLEFGSVGCAACKQMETIMEEIKESRTDVKVVFINITKADNKKLSKYFGIAAIPTQVVLDKESKEIFRHTGYISSKELSQNFK